MVSQDSPPHQSSSMLRQFIQSPNQLENQNLNTFPHSLGLMPSIHSFEDRISRFSASQESEMSHTRHFMDLLGAAANETNNHHVQRLSLSLGSQMGFPPSHEVQFRQSSSYQSDYSFNCNNNNNTASFAPSSSSYGTESFFLAMKNSRYLRPAQSLLQEIARVGGKSVEINNEKYVMNLIQSRRRGGGLASELRAELCSSMNGNLMTPERQELHITLSKLVALLEEIDVRYEKYYQQLEEVVSSFEQIAGLGAGKSYTALALQAMSRHFCSLRDGIVSQINGARRKLLSSNLSHHVSNGISQLSLFDEEGRHQHQEAAGRLSLQQLGLLQCQRQQWRPIRGLPETSVAILRSWLFEHFLNPYPNDSEKLMLASQTGLTKNQVANWFINARVRLWKPMIEEMYKEEFAESSEDSNPSHQGANNRSSRATEAFARDDHSDD
ncbi:unnamed protein product [Linum tenue]|uniref:Homeobox domain-containing protein n=1 Tax=Linum tenue TaxID=586396 RepID=A0AAV0LP96_9ROSI|nr:unnamed protein product [Linum tenue]